MKKLFITILIIACLVVALFVGFKFINKSDSSVIANTRFGFEDIGELATEEHYFTKVESYEGDPLKLFGKDIPFTTSKIIYSVDGYVKAGCDFSEIVVDRNESSKEMVIKLPLMKILDTCVDEDSIKIFDERNCIFNPLDGAETFASLSEIEKEAEADALNSGILEKAYNNTKIIIEGFVKQNVPGDYTIIIK